MMDGEEQDEKWTVGGRAGSRGSALVFRCSALSAAPCDPPAGQLHMVYKTHQAETKLLSAILNAHGFIEVSQDVNDFNLLWTGIHPKPQVFRSLTPHQRVNHFPRSYELTRKDRLYKNIERMQYAKGVKHFDFIPQTFVMPTDFRELTSSHYRLKGPWIIKPVASSRGRGIYIVNSPDEVPLEESVVVAKYIDNPLLVSGHKCDLRLYVAVTSFDPLVAYMYEEGLVRFATVKYDTTRNNLWNPCMHLCNYSINKHHSDYIKSDDAEAENVGHKWTLSALLRHLRSVNIDTALLMQRIEETVVKSLLSTAPSIVAACKLFIPHHSNCFELFGFDLLIDDTLKPWLLEVNLSPSLGCDSPLDMKVKSALLVDLLTLVGIPAIDPMTRPRYTKTLRRDGERAGSADTLPKVKHLSRLSNSSQSLTAEESRILSNIRSQFSRRGGFVRIFPAPNTWKMYNQYLDSVTGIPGPSSRCAHVKSHNLNYLVHTHLFPEVMLGPRPFVYERIARYERVLTKGHTECFQDSVVKSEMVERLSPVDGKVLKRELIKCLEDGFKFSQTQARQVFSQYLHCILSKMSGWPNNKGSSQKMDDAHSDLVLKFVQHAASNLRTPYHVKSPSQSLTGKDRVAVIAKQLSDFLYQYNKETESVQENCTKSRDIVPNRLFHLFLSAARENDLEEVLLLNTRLYKCAQLFLGKCGPAPHKLKTLGLLQSLGTIRSKVTGRSSCECVHEKALPQT